MSTIYNVNLDIITCWQLSFYFVSDHRFTEEIINVKTSNNERCMMKKYIKLV